MDEVHSKGKLEVILGPVFSGKTSELIRRIQRYYFAGFRCLVIRYTSNNDSFKDSLVTHDGYKLDALLTSSLLEVQSFTRKFDVIGIDEGHYFTDLVEYCTNATDNGKKVIAAALDGNFERQGYPHVLGLVPLAESVDKFLAICMTCSNEAPFTRKVRQNDTEAVSLLYNYNGSRSENYAFFFNNLLLNWENVEKSLGCAAKANLDFADRYQAVEHVLWEIINSGGKLLLLTSSKEYKCLLSKSNWYCSCEVESIYDKFMNNPEDSNILLEATLNLTALLDRSLGNVVLLKEKEVPFLMRDLFLTQALEDILGSSPIFFMQLLMGNVKGLNLRNIAWHGFFSKNEINVHLVAMLFLLIPSIANILQSKNYILEEIPRRLPVNSSSFREQAEKFIKYNLDLEQYSSNFTELINKFPHISNGQRDYWFYAFELYCSGRYGNAIVILLPLMEHMMRSVYCTSNNCLPKKMMAETSEFYITLDVMLEKKYETCENNFINAIGEKILIMLLDLFSYQHGPRLRDRVSHFEIEVQDLPKEVANYMFVLCLSIIQHLMPETVTRNETLQIDELNEVVNNYEPIYHPSSFWKRQVIEVLNKITEWSELPRPPEFKYFLLWKSNDNFELIETLLAIVMKKKHLSADELLQDLIEIAKKIKYPTVFRPSKEIEIVYLFKRINNKIEEIHNNITSNLNIRYNLWHSRQMRSRQRENYRRMLEYVYLVQMYLICILQQQIKIITGLLDVNEEQLIIFIKYFKLFLKYVENVSSLSQMDKNRWEEIKILTNKNCHIFIEMTKLEKTCC